MGRQNKLRLERRFVGKRNAGQGITFCRRIGPILVTLPANFQRRTEIYLQEVIAYGLSGFDGSYS